MDHIRDFAELLNIGKALPPCAFLSLQFIFCTQDGVPHGFVGSRLLFLTVIWIAQNPTLLLQNTPSFTPNIMSLPHASYPSQIKKSSIVKHAFIFIYIYIYHSCYYKFFLGYLLMDICVRNSNGTLMDYI